MGRKPGRPTTPKQVANQKACLVYYENYQSAGYAANMLDLNRHTVESYYQKFAELELSVPTDKFIKTQVAVKARVLSKLDRYIEKANKQIGRFEALLGTDGELSADGVNFERLLQKSLTDVNGLYQQKATLEMTPTLDIHIEAEIEKRFGHISKDTTIPKHEGKSKAK